MQGRPLVLVWWIFLGFSLTLLATREWSVSRLNINVGCLQETPLANSQSLYALPMKTLAGFVNIISAYAPTLTSTPEGKDQFYEALQETLSRSSEGIYLLGDFKARVGTDWQAWPTCFSHFGVRRMNENRQRLLELCCHHGLCITNSSFKCKELHKVSWRHPWSCNWHQLDLVITRRADLSSVLHTRSYHSADCASSSLMMAVLQEPSIS